MIAALRAAGLPPWLLLLGAGVLVGAGGLIWLRSQADAVETEKAATAQAEARAATSEAQADLNREVTRVLERQITRETTIERIVEDETAAIEAAPGGDRLISEDVERALRAGIERLRREAAGDPAAGAEAGDPGRVAGAVPGDEPAVAPAE